MRERLFIIGALVIAGLGMLVLVPSVRAVDQSPDKVIGPQLEIMKGSPDHPTTSPGTESRIGELGTGSEKPMGMEDSVESFYLDLKNLKMPDAADAERARESDIRSSVSF